MYALLLAGILCCSYLPQAPEVPYWPHDAVVKIAGRALLRNVPTGTCSPLTPLLAARRTTAPAVIPPHVLLQMVGLYLLVLFMGDLLLGALLLLRYAADPFIPRLRLLTRHDWIKYAHGLGYAVKSSAVKHIFYPARCKPIFTSVAPPRATMGQRFVHVLLVCMLFAGTTATAMQVGQVVHTYPTLASTFRQATTGIHLEQAVTALHPHIDLSASAATVPFSTSSAIPTAAAEPDEAPPRATDCVTPFTPHGTVDPAVRVLLLRRLSMAGESVITPI
jgi:hypothetical protein